jgi:hypothetical protein
MNYYLNALNEMRRQQQNNMMGGGGYQGVGSTPPSGPLGLGPSQDRSSWRDAIQNMNPLVSFGLSRVPGVGLPLSIAKAANYGLNKYEAAQLAATLDARQKAQEQFRASEITAMNAPQQNTPQQSFQTSEIADSRSINTPQQSFQTSEKSSYGPPGPEYGPPPTGNIFQNAYEGGMATNSFNAANMGGNVPDDSKERLSVISKPDIVSDPISTAPLVGTPLAPMATDVVSQGVVGQGMGSFNSSDTGSETADPFSGQADSSQAFAKGGMVTRQRLMGRAPAPDDGYGALQGGEYVITKAAVEKYGKRLLDAINNGTFKGFKKTI